MDEVSGHQTAAIELLEAFLRRDRGYPCRTTTEPTLDVISHRRGAGKTSATAHFGALLPQQILVTDYDPARDAGVLRRAVDHVSQYEVVIVDPPVAVGGNLVGADDMTCRRGNTRHR